MRNRIHRGNAAFTFEAFESLKTIEWLYPVVAFIAVNNGAELLGILREYGLTRAGLSLAGTLVLRSVWLWIRDNRKEVVN